MRKKGFTLIELLAVIVILAVIALIATPIILNIIEKARKSAFKDSAYGIKATVESKAMENVIEGKEIENTYQFPFEELKFSGSRPAGGTIAVDKDGKVSMAIHNNKWCAVKEKEETEIRVIDYEEETCKILGIVEPPKPTLKNPEEIMTSEAVGENGTIKEDTSGNKRYAGSNPNNWVCFGSSSITSPGSCDANHKWRIIGIDGSGRMKIMTNYYYSTGKRWDTSGGTYGSNNWGRPADLKTELNGSSFYSNNTYIDATHRGYIINATWYTGGQATTSTYTLQSFVNGERSNSTTGYVGLMSMVDFGYAGSECTTSTVMTNTGNACMSNNWIGYSNYQWSITPYNSAVSPNVWAVRDGYVNIFTANYYRCGVRPVVYLDSSVKIVGGTGTKTDPYILTK